MDQKRKLNFILYLLLTSTIVFFVYKNNNLSKQLVEKRKELKKSTNTIKNAQKEYKRLEKEYTKIKDDLKLIKNDVVVLKDIIKTKHKNNITQVKSISTKLSDIILEQENYQFPSFDTINAIGPIFKNN